MWGRGLKGGFIYAEHFKATSKNCLKSAGYASLSFHAFGGWRGLGRGGVQIFIVKASKIAFNTVLVSCGKS